MMSGKNSTETKMVLKTFHLSKKKRKKEKNVISMK